MSYEDSIILLGPMNIGKSTMAIRLVQKYLFQFINCDNLVDYYIMKEKHERSYFCDLLYEKGFEECCKETDAFFLAFSTEILKMVREIGVMSIVDFGGNNIAYKDKKLNDLIIGELKGFHNVIKLLPYEDEKKSFDYFRKIFSNPLNIKINDYIYECLTNGFPEYKTIYINDQTENEIFDQIDKYINRNQKIERAEIPTKEKALQKMRISNKYFPNSYNI